MVRVVIVQGNQHSFSRRDDVINVHPLTYEYLCLVLQPGVRLYLGVDNFLPKPNTPEVVSQPRMACRKRILSAIVLGRRACNLLMFQHLLSFSLILLGSGLKKMSCLVSFAWWIRSTSRFVSSPTRTVSCVDADVTAVSTMRVSASPLAWCISHPALSSLWDNKAINRC